MTYRKYFEVKEMRNKKISVDVRVGSLLPQALF